jgi:hypothetical protein
MRSLDAKKEDITDQRIKEGKPHKLFLAAGCIATDQSAERQTGRLRYAIADDLARGSRNGGVFPQGLNTVAVCYCWHRPRIA